MFRNYFIVAWRNLKQNKLYSFINIAGLVIGISCCILIFLFVQNELSYDKFNEKIDDTYRLTLHVHQPQNDIQSAATAPLMGPLLKDNFPEIKKVLRLSMPFERPLSYKENKTYNNKVVTSDSTFFDVFTFPMLEGDQKLALNSPYKIVLTESLAKKYFGNTPALGKTMVYANDINVTVSGVIKDVPQNSHLSFDALVSRSTIIDINKKDTMWMLTKEENWYWIFQYTYFILDKKCDVAALESKISALTEKQYPDRRKQSGLYYSGKLQPVKDIHLHSDFDREIKPNGDIKYVYIFSATALLILVIACFNFINLSTARSTNRSKEIGLRKVVGANRVQLIQQFLGESTLFTIIANIFSLAVVYAVLPTFNAFAGVKLSPGIQLFWIYISIIVIVGLFSGLYPALLISSFKPVIALKGQIRYGWKDLVFRKGLVILQFSIAVTLLIGTYIILQQLNYIQDKKMGIHKEQMLRLNFRSGNNEKRELFINEIVQKPNIISASHNSFNFKETPSIPLSTDQEEIRNFNAHSVILIDENFVDNFGLSIVAGRNISKDFPTDATEAFLINESAVKAFGWKTPEEALGKKINWAGEKNGKIVGVVKDFNYTSFHESINPLVLHVFEGMAVGATIRIDSKNTKEAIKTIESLWKKTFTDVPFEYSFMQEDFNAMYKSEQKLSELLNIFTLLSILVACLGLFGLAAFSIKQRIKEIGVRKVLGASVYDVTILTSKDFLKLVAIAVIIAFPLAYYTMNKWLQDFAYKIEISWMTFVLGGTLAIIIAFITVSVQAIKAAVANPIKSLRTE